MPDLDHVLERTAIDAGRQAFEEMAEIGGVEFLRRRELPQQRAEAIAQFADAGLDEPPPRVAGVVRSLLAFAP